MSLLFRMQLAWPEESFRIFNVLLGDKWANGVMTNDIYLSLVTHTRYDNVLY
jgi:cytochrome c oxidase subunit 1